jgi:hypothetical protein
MRGDRVPRAVTLYPANGTRSKAAVAPPARLPHIGYSLARHRGGHQNRRAPHGLT